MKRGGRHPASAGWFRVAGRLDINEMVPKSVDRWHSVPEAPSRWLSTNHLMGDGYWIWIIPLGSGHTSIGAVVHEPFHDFEQVRTLEHLQAFIRAHEPVLAKRLETADVLDFGCIKNYCHTVQRCWSPDRWALVGEAGAFSDPLYSPGTDYIAFANSFTTECIRTDLEKGDLEARSRELNVQYRALIAGSIGVYRQAGPVYGHARAMATKIYWDNFAYWNYPCQYFAQDIYKRSGAAHMPFTQVGARFVELSERMQSVLSTWAELAPETHDTAGDLIVLPQFPSVLIDAHCALARSMSVDETLAYMQKRLEEAEEIFAELIFRIMQELGPELGKALWTRVEADTWDLHITERRLELEALEGRTRRRALPELVRDIERCLGQPRRHEGGPVIAAFVKPKAPSLAAP